MVATCFYETLVIANQSLSIFQNWEEILFMACFIQRHQQHHTKAAFVWIISNHHSILFAIVGVTPSYNKHSFNPPFKDHT